MADASFFDRQRTVAPSHYNRWLVPPAALAIHLSIGQVYALSVFNLPLSKLIGIKDSAPGDWSLTMTAYIFSLAIAILGLSAAVFGKWLERVGPRLAMFVAAACFGGGFMVAALGVYLHQFWIVMGGYGVLGGIGLGLGYISPVSTLIKWFPDRPGMATGLAIMGFGGGAMIASPLSTDLMAHFKTATSMGVWETFLTLGVLYFVFMMFGVLTVRLPSPDWKPSGAPPARQVAAGANVEVNEAMRTPQFYLLWLVLCMNVSAGIGVLSQASPMIQETVGVSAAAAGGFVGLLSLTNMIGRFFWSSTSDYIGRKATYAIFFLLGIALYVLTPTLGRSGNVALFVLAYAIILSMYGGGFATIPAYLRDKFGTMQVGAIHGRLLTAWSVAGVLGPTLLSRIRDERIKHGVPKADAYSTTMYIMAGLLAIGFIANMLVTKVDAKHQYKGDAR